MKTVAFIPVKLNNERTPGKNVKKLSDGTPLINLIQKSLLSVKESGLINEIYVFCSDDAVNEYILDGVNFSQRSSSIDAPTAKSNDIVRAFTSAVDADIYVMAHATAPFLSAESIAKCIEAVQSDEYDSAFPVLELHEFFWRSGESMNYSPDNVPRTQDMESIYMETTGAYVFKKSVSEYNRRIGYKPYLHAVSKIEATDIDYPDDFEIADAIYTNILKKD